MLQFLLTICDEKYHSRIEYIYNHFHDDMMRFAVSKFNSHGIENSIYNAEDAVQNAFVKITKNIDNIDFSKSEKSVKNYCFGILSNEIYNILDGDSEILEFAEEAFSADDASFVEKLLMKENYDRVVEAIESMDVKYSSTLYFYFTRDMTVNEIAEMMGISPKTVYTRLERGKVLALKMLKAVK